MARKIRSDSVSAAVKAAVSAVQPDIEPLDYVDLSDDAKPFFRAITRARAREEWDDLQITIAMQLARCQLQIEVEEKDLLLEGTIVKNDKGTQIANPRFTVLNQLKNSQLALMRSMALHATAKIPTRDLNKQRGTEKTARRLAQEVASEDDSLLA